VNVGPQDGARIPDEVPILRQVARGAAMSAPADQPIPTETRPLERPEKPKFRPLKVYAPTTPAPAAPINSAAVDPAAATTSGTTIVVPATTLPPAPSVAPPSAAAPPSVPAQTAANPAPAAAAPPAKKSINDIPVAPLD